MKKKSSIRLGLVIFSLTLLLSSSLAFGLPNPDPPPDFNAVYMTSGNGNTDVVTEYNWDELPWLYLQLGETPDTYFDLTITIWDSPTHQTYWKPNFNPTSQNIWISGDELLSVLTPVDWVNIKELGLWNVEAAYARCNSGCGYTTGNTSFTVVPEPVSSSLFLVGAATLGFRRFRRKSIAA